MVSTVVAAFTPVTAAVVPLNRTMSLTTKPVPLIVTTVPTGPDMGEKLVIVSPPAARTDGPGKPIAMAITTVAAVMVMRPFMPRLLSSLAAELRRWCRDYAPRFGLP